MVYDVYKPPMICGFPMDNPIYYLSLFAYWPSPFLRSIQSVSFALYFPGLSFTRNQWSAVTQQNLTNLACRHWHSTNWCWASNLLLIRVWLLCSCIYLHCFYLDGLHDIWMPGCLDLLYVHVPDQTPNLLLFHDFEWWHMGLKQGQTTTRK